MMNRLLILSATSQLYMEALHVPWPVRKRSNSDHEQRGRSKPGRREVAILNADELARRLAEM